MLYRVVVRIWDPIWLTVFFFCCGFFSVHKVTYVYYAIIRRVNIIHPSMPRSPFQFPHQDPIHPLSFPIRATCPAHLILLVFITRTILGEDYKPFSSSLCNLLHSPVTSSLLGPNILLNTMFSNTHSFLSSRNVNDQVSHPYKTTGKIIVSYILSFKFLVSNLEDKRFCTE